MSERCKAIDKELSRNGSGYYDPTAYKAMKRVEADERKYGRDYERFYNLLNTIFYICELAGFHVEGRIVLTDKRQERCGSDDRLWNNGIYLCIRDVRNQRSVICCSCWDIWSSFRDLL